MPRHSFRNRFSQVGRIENEWAGALAEEAPGAGLDRLRSLFGRFGENPEGAAPQWLAFQDSVLDERYRPLLTSSDFDELAAVGERLAGAKHVGLHQTWRPLAEAGLRRDAPGDRAWTYDLLTRLYWSPLAYEEARADAAATLARQPALEPGHFKIYADLLHRHVRPPAPVADTVAAVLSVGFDSDTGALQRAGALADELTAVQHAHPGAEVALGMRDLLVRHDPASARKHFSAAHEADPYAVEPLHGLVATRLQAREPESALSTVADANLRAPGSVTPRIAQLAEVARTLAWLELPLTNPDRPPTPAPTEDAAALAEVAAGKDAGPWADYARGRMALLEGDAPLARRLLAPLAEADPGRPEFAYHAAWALLLCGEPEGVAQCFRALDERIADGVGESPEATDATVTVDVPAGLWAVGCLLLDAEPQRAADEEVRARMAPPEGFAEVAQARWNLTAGGPLPELPWAGPLRRANGTSAAKPAAGVAEQLETLRTALGVAVARRQPAAAAPALQHALFERLPKAERMLWTGVLALSEDPDRGRALLKEAHECGRDRAALILAAHDVTEGRPADALPRLAGQEGPKAELVRAWTDAVDGRVAAATGRFEALAGKLPQALYALGVFDLREALSGWASGQAERALVTAQRASARLSDARAMAGEAVPEDAADLARAARMLTERMGSPNSGNQPWPTVRHHPWAGWMLGIAQLAAEPRTAPLQLCESLSAQLDDAGVHPTDEGAEHGPGGRAAVSGLATALARAALLTEDAERHEALAEHLSRLARRHDLPEIRRLAARTAALTALRDEGTQPGDPEAQDPLVALTAARAALRKGRREEAVRILRVVPPGEGDAQRLVATVADALGGLSPQEPPQTDGSAAAPEAVAVPLQVARVAALADAEPERAVTALMDLLRDHDVTGLIDLNNAIPVLCARAARGGQAARREGGSTRQETLAGLVRRLAAPAAAGDPPALDVLTLARCATALGDHETAEELWSRATEAQPDVAEEEYARFVCHQAVTARENDDPVSAAALLRRAARFGASNASTAAQLARDLEFDDRADALLTALFPDAVLGWQRPGRYVALETAAASHTQLWKALTGTDEARIRRMWASCVLNRPRDIDLHHTLAVLYREEALDELARTGTAGTLLVTATALWALLLATPAFWEMFEELDEAEVSELRGRLAGELLEAHRTQGAQALVAENAEGARLHLRALDECWKGPEETRGLLDASLGVFGSGVDEDAFAQISREAERLLEAWSLDLVSDAERRLNDTGPERDKDADQNYEAAIVRLEPLVRLGVPLAGALRAGLRWHNEWQNCLYVVGKQERFAEVVERARPFADLLAPLCTPGLSYQLENQALAAHLVDRATAESGAEEGRPLLEQALEWDPANRNANHLLDQARWLAELEGVTERLASGDPDGALRRLERLSGEAGVAETVAGLKAQALMMKGIQLQGGKRFAEAERHLRDAVTTAPTEDLVHEAESHLCTALNNHAVHLIDQAVRGGAWALDQHQLDTAQGLLLRALRLDPQNESARRNLTQLRRLKGEQ